MSYSSYEIALSVFEEFLKSNAEGTVNKLHLVDFLTYNQNKIDELKSQEPADDDEIIEDDCDHEIDQYRYILPLITERSAPE